MAALTHQSKKGLGAFTAVALGLGTVVAINLAAHADYSNPGSSVATAINADAIGGGGVRQLTKWQDIEAAPSGNDINGGALVSGYGVVMNENTTATNGGGNAPLPDGTKIYLQWMDKDGQVSPIYYAQTHTKFSNASPGAYVFSLPKWTDAYGKEHVFLPGSFYHPRLKVWFEPFADPITGSQVVQIRDAGSKGRQPATGGNPQMMSSEFGKTIGTGVNFLDLQYYNNYTVFGYQMPAPYMVADKARWGTTTTEFKGDAAIPTDSVAGNVWLEMSGSSAGQGPYFNVEYGDTPAEGYNVVMSVLTPKCAMQAREIQRDAGADHSKLVSDMKAMIKADSTCVDQTQTAKVDKDGNYQVTFKPGTFSRDSATKTLLVRDFLYGYVTDPNGNELPSYSSFTDNVFNIPNQRANRLEPLVGASFYDGPKRKFWRNVRFAVVPYYGLGLNLDKDVIEEIGGVATPLVSGASVYPGGFRIAWTDKNGKDVTPATGCDGLGSTGTISSCSYAIPEGTQDGDFFTATLYLGDSMMGADSVQYKSKTASDPSLQGIAPDVIGVINELLPEQVMTVSNPGKVQGLTCSAVGLPKGVQTYYDESKHGCVISGTPQELKEEGSTYDLTISWVAPDGSTKSDTQTGKVLITKPGDDDNDGVDNHNDKCPNTPEGAIVDGEGCSVDPTIKGEPFTVNGIKGEPISPVEIVVANPGKAKITECVADVYKPVSSAGSAPLPSNSSTSADPNKTEEEATSQEPSGQEPPASTQEESAPASGSVSVSGGVAGTGVVVSYTSNESTTTGLPEGLTLQWDEAKSACVISGTTSTAIEDPMDVTVYVNYTKADDPNAEEKEIEAPGKVRIHDTGLDDDDHDGVINRDDHCPGTPENTAVDANGCALAPVVGTFDPITGKVNNPIEPVTVPVSNTGNNTIKQCVATGLVPGLTIRWDSAASACVIEGTPTSPSDPNNNTVTVSVIYDSPDDDPATGDIESKPSTGKIDVTYGDGDGDGVTDDVDKCPGTPSGAKVNPATGCAVAPELGSVPPITWSIPADPNTALIPVNVLVPVANPGQATGLVCHAKGLIPGLSIVYDEAQNACVISGTPTTKDAYKGEVQVFVDYNAADDAPDAGTLTVGPSKGTITVTKEQIPTPKPTITTPTPTPKPTVVPPSDTDKDGVNDDTDKCPNTPSGAQVDPQGCSYLPTVDTFTVVGTVGEALSTDVTVSNPGKAKLTGCSSADLPQGLTVKLNSQATACVVSGTVATPVTSNATIALAYEMQDRNESGEVSNVGKVIIGKPAPGDSDNDGVNDDVDKCPGTPSGAKVDKNGCSVAPQFGAAKDINGEVGSPISAVTIPVSNPGKVDLGECVAAGLPAGVGIKWADASKTACVISGTPDEVIKGKYTVEVTYKPIDSLSNDPLTVSTTAKVTVSDNDDDADGVPNSKDKCASTPNGAAVDANGCSVAPTVPTVPTITGEINKPIDPVIVPINNPGDTKLLQCSATGLAPGLKIALNEDKTACVISGTPTTETNGNYTVNVTYDPKDDGNDEPKGPATGEGTIQIIDSDKDKDTVPNDVDHCPGTPAGAKVDASGCSVAPVIGEVPPINGTVGKEITPVEIPVSNPGKTALGECTATGLPKGLTIGWNANKTACVISGTPSEEAGGNYTVDVSYNPADDGSNEPKNTTETGPINIVKPEPGDNDGDGVKDDVDKCPGTPGGAKVDDKGCSVLPTVGDVPDVLGTVGKEITPVEVPISNPGKSFVAKCEVEGLPAGLSAKLNAEGNACVISGTPQEAIDGKITVTITYNPADDGKDDDLKVGKEGKVKIDTPALHNGGTSGGGLPGWGDDTTNTPKPDNPPVANKIKENERLLVPGGTGTKPPVAGIYKSPAEVLAQPMLPQTLARTGVIAAPFLVSLALVLVVGGVLLLRRTKPEED